MRFWLVSFFISCLGHQAFAQGLVQLPSEEKARYENQIRSYFQIPNVQLQVQRLGGEGLSHFHFKFGKLTFDEFNRIQSLLKFPFPTTLPLGQFNSRKEYSLEDFLLPKMQAPLGKIFTASEQADWMEKLSGSNELTVESNCWSTAYDILQSGSSPMTSYFYIHSDQDEMTSLLRDLRYSKAVQFRDLKPYDYILYYSKEADGKFALDHVAVSIGAGLAYEKTGNSELDFYEIQPIEAITTARKRINSHLKLNIEYRRMTAPFPHPFQMWGAKAKGLLSNSQLSQLPSDVVDQIVVAPGFDGNPSYTRIRPIQVLKNTKGQYVMDPTDPLSKQFRVPPLIGIVQGGAKAWADARLSKELCVVHGTGNVQITRFNEVGFQVKLISYMDEEASCVASDGKKMKSFWLSQESVNFDH